MMHADTPDLTALAAGFDDPPRRAQQVFRSAMQAMARPGTLHGLDATLSPPEGLAPAAAALLLTLTDGATRVWLPDAFAGAPLAQWLRFHTGALPASAPDEADFAWTPHAASMPALDAFALGTDAFPDRSTTLVLQVEALASDEDRDADAAPGRALTLRGPGIPAPRTLHVAGLPAGFAAQWQAMRGRFPRGVDLYLCCGSRMAALPRSTDVEMR